MPHNLRILLADDDADDHQFFDQAIQDSFIINHQLISVYDGRELIDYLCKSGKHANNVDPQPDVIVLDLNMPKVDGITALDKVRTVPHLRDIPIFVLSTSKEERIYEKCKALGCKDYYTKAGSIPELRDIIHDMLVKSAPDIDPLTIEK
jgi:CheY-like chemotaxis protein